MHVYAAAALWRRAKKARPIKYVVKKHTGAIPASRMMRWGGVTILALPDLAPAELHHRQGQRAGRGRPNDPFNLLVDTFDVWWLTLIYLVAMAMLGAHLHHGIWSATQTLGLTGSERTRTLAKRSAFALAVIISGGFSLVPIFVLAGVISK